MNNPPRPGEQTRRGKVSFVVHFVRHGQVYGCRWAGRRPCVWTLANLVRVPLADFAKWRYGNDQ